MDALELLELIQKGESSLVQFKERVNDAYKIGTELVAFSYVKGGTSIPRNRILFSNARYLLPYVGVGNLIPRAYENSPDLELINDTERELFISIIKRKV